MIKFNEKLTILHDISGAFTDISNSLLDYTRGVVSISYTTATDCIYIGFEKPINQIYVELDTVASTNSELELKYYNGSGFVDVSGLFDDTKSFERSGFIRWERELAGNVASEINGETRFWYQVKLSTDLNVSLKGINIVFSDDQDLKREVFEIMEMLPNGEASHILTHVAARDEIIQRLNNSGKQKFVDNTGADLSSFDLLDISQVKLASTFLALSKIYFVISDEIDDKYERKFEFYKTQADSIINNMRIDIDIDDDGEKDVGETQTINYGFIKRL